jgi:hypothetical protein
MKKKNHYDSKNESLSSSGGKEKGGLDRVDSFLTAGLSHWIPK